MPIDPKGKKERAKLALEYYIKREGMDLPQPDGEDFHKADMIIDRIADMVVELAVWFSESAEWMRWHSEREPPPWLRAFLTKEEIAGNGPPRITPKAGPPEPLANPKGKKGRRRRPRLSGKWVDPSSPDFIGLRPENIDYLLEHYHEIPPINPKTGKPHGLIC